MRSFNVGMYVYCFYGHCACLDCILKPWCKDFFLYTHQKTLKWAFKFFMWHSSLVIIVIVLELLPVSPPPSFCVISHFSHILQPWSFTTHLFFPTTHLFIDSHLQWLLVNFNVTSHSLAPHIVHKNDYVGSIDHIFHMRTKIKSV